MHCPKARCSAIQPGYNPGLSSEKPSVENAKAPDYGAFGLLSQQSTPLQPKLARHLQ